MYSRALNREIGMDENVLLTIASGEAVANLNYLIESRCIWVSSDANGVACYKAI